MLASNDKHKDRLFKFVFGNPEHKEWTLSLYNALNGSHYTNPEDIEFNTIEDAVYMGMKNDVSFIVAFTINIWEHQSTYNPNMPLRIYLYLAHLLEKYLVGSETYIYGHKLVRIPEPKCVCFYNGTEKQPEESILKLSDAYITGNSDADLELKVRLVNVNYGHNMALMDACSAMNEYASLIDMIREHNRVMGNLESAVDAAIDEMPDDFELKKFLVQHRAEVKGMIIAEWDAEKAYQYARKEGMEDGFAEGHAEGRVEGLVAGRAEGLAAGRAEGLVAGREEGLAAGRAEGREIGLAAGREEGLAAGREEGLAEGISEEKQRVASDMLKDNYPLSAIQKISRLSEDAIRNIANSLGLTIA